MDGVVLFYRPELESSVKFCSVSWSAGAQLSLAKLIIQLINPKYTHNLAFFKDQLQDNSSLCALYWCFTDLAVEFIQQLKYALIMNQFRTVEGQISVSISEFIFSCIEALFVLFSSLRLFLQVVFFFALCDCMGSIKRNKDNLILTQTA